MDFFNNLLVTDGKPLCNRGAEPHDHRRKHHGYDYSKDRE